MLDKYEKHTPRPTKLCELKIVLQTIWNELPQNARQKAVLSFHKRLLTNTLNTNGPFQGQQINDMKYLWMIWKLNLKYLIANNGLFTSKIGLIYENGHKIGTDKNFSAKFGAHVSNWSFFSIGKFRWKILTGSLLIAFSLEGYFFYTGCMQCLTNKLTLKWTFNSVQECSHSDAYRSELLIYELLIFV